MLYPASSSPGIAFDQVLLIDLSWPYSGVLALSTWIPGHPQPSCLLRTLRYYMIPAAILTLHQGRIRFSCLCALVWLSRDCFLFLLCSSPTAIALSLLISAEFPSQAFGHFIPNIPFKIASSPPCLPHLGRPHCQWPLVTCT